MSDGALVFTRPASGTRLSDARERPAVGVPFDVAHRKRVRATDDEQVHGGAFKAPEEVEMQDLARQFTLYVSDLVEAREIGATIKAAGYEPVVVVCAGDQDTPYLQSAFVKIVGRNNIKRFLGPEAVTTGQPPYAGGTSRYGGDGLPLSALASPREQNQAEEREETA